MKLRWWLRSLTPAYWVQIARFSPAWDRHLNAMLDAGIKFNTITEYGANINDIKVWISNHPYGSFTIAVPGCKEVRPRRVTIARAYEALTKQQPDCEQVIAAFLAGKQPTTILTTSLTTDQLAANRQEQADYKTKRGFEQPGEPKL